MKSIKSHRFLLVCVCALCGILLVGGFLRNSTVIAEPEIPLAENFKILNAGDTVTVKIYANKLTDVYGYQFKLHFDESALEYSNVSSSIPEIGLIFPKQFPGYLLVGATKVGQVQGFSSDSESVPVCEVILRANKNGVSPQILLQEVNTIDSLLNYNVGETNWGFELIYA